MNGIVDKFSVAASDIKEGLKANCGAGILPTTASQKSLRVNAAWLAAGGALALVGAPVVGVLVAGISAGLIAADSHNAGKTKREQRNAAPLPERGV